MPFSIFAKMQNFAKFNPLQEFHEINFGNRPNTINIIIFLLEPFFRDFLRIKSQRIKICRLCYRFSTCIDFWIHTLGFFFPKVRAFFLEITNIRQKSWEFWVVDFFLEIFNIHKLVWIFLWIFGCVLSMFFLKLLLILNFTKAVLTKMAFRSIFV